MVFRICESNYKAALITLVIYLYLIHCYLNSSTTRKLIRNMRAIGCELIIRDAIYTIPIQSFIKHSIIPQCARIKFNTNYILIFKISYQNKLKKLISKTFVTWNDNYVLRYHFTGAALYIRRDCERALNFNSRTSLNLSWKVTRIFHIYTTPNYFNYQISIKD